MNFLLQLSNNFLYPRNDCCWIIAEFHKVQLLHFLRFFLPFEVIPLLLFRSWVYLPTHRADNQALVPATFFPLMQQRLNAPQNNLFLICRFDCVRFRKRVWCRWLGSFFINSYFIVSISMRELIQLFYLFFWILNTNDVNFAFNKIQWNWILLFTRWQFRTSSAIIFFLYNAWKTCQRSKYKHWQEYLCALKLLTCQFPQKTLIL